MSQSSRVRPGRRRAIEIGMLAFFAALGWRLFDLQVSEYGPLAARARSQTESSLSIPGPRGPIVDAAGRLLAVSVPVSVLAAEPKRIGLAGLMALERAAAVPGRLTKRADAAWIEVRRDCDEGCVAAVQRLVEAKQLPADTLHWAPGFKRVYPHGEAAAQVLGFVNLDGTLSEGLERFYDEGLRSRQSRLLRITDAKQEAVDHVDGDATPPPANLLRLTLDLRIQTVLEQALLEALDETGSRAARGVVIDPRSGALLAIASAPSFNPNAYGKGPRENLRNTAIERANEPGSVMKPFTAAALIENHKYIAGEAVNCENGQWKKGVRVIHDTHPHGILTLPEVIEVSSNIGIVKFSQRLSESELYATFAAFGFGQRTGVDLPSESRGVFRPVRAWGSMTKDSNAFGHEIEVTTLQLAVAFSVLANGGYRVTPRIAKEWEQPDGTIVPIAETPPTKVLGASTAALVKQFMRRVVAEKHGTGKKAAVLGFDVAGKTGSAEMVIDGHYDKRLNLSSFAGMAPIDDPAAVVVISLDAPQGAVRTGGATAAPAFAEVMAELLRLERIAPDNLPDPDQDGSQNGALLATESAPAKKGPKGVRG